MLLGADIIEKLNRVWLSEQNVMVSDIDMTVVSDDENTCVTTKIMNNDVNDVKSPITSDDDDDVETCLLYTSPSPRDRQKSRMPSSA